MTAIGLYMLLSGVTGNPGAIPAPEVADSNVVLVTSENRKEESTKEEDVEAHVRDYFSDTPILAEVARCESQYRQFGTDGKALRGIKDRDDVGVMQINTRYHGAEAKKLGLDLYTLDGNLAYAEVLYAKEGGKPWLASAPCWSGNLTKAKNQTLEVNS